MERIRPDSVCPIVHNGELGVIILHLTAFKIALLTLLLIMILIFVLQVVLQAPLLTIPLGDAWFYAQVTLPCMVTSIQVYAS